MPAYLLGIPSEATAKIRELVAWAAKPENWYDVEAYARGEVQPPGGDKRYELFVGEMRCIFSYTVVASRKQLFRHLSISVADPNEMPDPGMSVALAKVFGFTGMPGQDLFMGEGPVAPGGHKNGVILQVLPYPSADA